MKKNKDKSEEVFANASIFQSSMFFNQGVSGLCSASVCGSLFGGPIFESKAYRITNEQRNSSQAVAADINQFLGLNLVEFSCLEFGEEACHARSLFVDCEEKIAVRVNSRADSNEYTVYAACTSRENLTRLKEFCAERLAPRNKQNPTVNMVVQTMQGFDKMPFSIKSVDVDLEESYNEDFLAIDQTIQDFFASQENSGLAILHGEPGCGKTYYIRHLLKCLLEKPKSPEILYIPTTMVEGLTSPSFIGFLQQQIGSIVVIEDAERIVENRGDNIAGSSAVANILNMADGILGDIFRLKILTTFNMDIYRVDPALLRKGRCVANYEFGKLSQEKSTKLIQKLGFDSCADEPMTLAEIYNLKQQSFAQKPKKKCMGFGATN